MNLKKLQLCTELRFVGLSNLKQDSQCKYNIALRRVPTTFFFLQWKSNKCVFVGLVTQHAMYMRHIVVCDLSDSTVFSYII
jgi:chromosome condensin MukBEF MukE localization factor